MPDGQRPPPRPLPPRARQRRRHARRPAQGGAPLRGAHALRGAPEGIGGLRRAGDRALSASGAFRVAAIALLAAASLLLAASPLPIERFRSLVFDGWQRVMPRERLSDQVVVVAIDEPALAAHGQWPWPRDRVADLVNRIAAGKPLVIGMDIFFPEPDRYSPGGVAARLEGTAPDIAARLRGLPSNDALLGKALAAVPSVLGVAGLETRDPRFAGPPRSPPVRYLEGAGAGLRVFPGHLRNVPEVDAGAAGHGLYSIDLEGGVARQLQMVARFDEATVPTLAVEMIRVAVGAQLGMAGGAPLTLAPSFGRTLEMRFGEYAVPMQPDGRAYVRYGHTEPSRFVSAADVLDGRFDASQLEGKLVLVGFTGLGLADLVATPLGETVFGVENHAQAAEAILEGQFLRRIDLAPRIEAALLVAFGLGLFVLVPRTNAQRSAAILAAGSVALIAGGAAAFRFAGLLFDPLGPVLGAIAVFGVMQAGSLAEAQRQRQQLREQAARMAGELDAAKRIQMGLLPDPREVLSEGRLVVVAAIREPARTVGGDFYDCFMLDDRRLFFVVADVSGKGLPASLFMASVKSIIKSAALTVEGSLGGVLARAQDEIHRENPESLFVTALACVLDLETGELEYANAGHEPAWSHQPHGKPERLDASGGPPLCVLDMYSYPSTRRTLRRGEWLLALSDGATEAMNPAKEFFGADRLGTSLGWLGDAPEAVAIVTRVRDDVRRFSAGAEPADDLTLLAIRWIGPADAVSGR
ncbi:MAG: CHASE2 domain-containing protein [Betaproteobacteria bacterium]|nr:CHASE2 domain-containing protein [Betaproteobacteria bacterium]